MEQEMEEVEEEEMDEEMEEEMEEQEEEMNVGEEAVGVQAMDNYGVEPQNPAPVQGGPNFENHGFVGEGLLPDPFAPKEDEDPQSDITDVDSDEPHYVISKDLFDELMRYLHGGGGPGAGANVQNSCHINLRRSNVMQDFLYMTVCSC